MSITLKNKYKFNKNDIIGKGGFGAVYKGYIIEDESEVAIKIEDGLKYNKKEYQIYRMISSNSNTATVIDYFEINDKSYLILELYKKNAQQILHIDPDEYFNKKDVLMLGIQIIQQLNILHNLGIIHRDVKPDNFVYDKKTNKFKLIDLGLCKPFLINKEHIKFRKSSSRSGTLRYMSINCHKKYTLSRRDDLISLAYALIYLYKKDLTWKNLKHKITNPSKTKLYKITKKLKKEFNKDTYDLPKPLSFLLDYSSGLKFSQKPNYSFIIRIFFDEIKGNDKYNGKWTWINDDIN